MLRQPKRKTNRAMIRPRFMACAAVTMDRTRLRIACAMAASGETPANLSKQEKPTILVVVGGGISGLSSARFFREAAGKQTRVLIIENHDDFGGHAKRNEFNVDGTFLLGYGGTYSIESPAPYSPVAKRVIQELGIEVSSYASDNNDPLYRSLGLKQKIFFDRETFGADRLVTSPYSRWGSATADPDGKNWQDFAAQAPLSAKAIADVKRIYTLDEDLYPGLSSDEKKAKLARISYADYLANIVKVDPQSCRFAAGASSAALWTRHRRSIRAGCMGAWLAWFQWA